MLSDTLMNTQRRLFPCWEQRCGLLVMLLSAGIALWQCGASESDEWREKMEPIIPQGYLCRHTAAPILVDGKLDEAAWTDAPWTSDFVDIQGHHEKNLAGA